MRKEIDLEFELHAYVDGDLDDEAMTRVEEYLADNPDTAAKVRAYLKQKDELRRYASVQVSPDEPAALRDLAKKLARRLKPGHFFPWRLAVVMPLVFAAGWLGHLLYVPLVQGPGYTNEVFQAHLLTSSDPSEILPLSPERMHKLFARIDEIERLPDLHQLGFQPIGAQLLPTDDGVVLHIPYRNASGTVVSWFLSHDVEAAEEAPRLLHRQNVSIVTWQHAQSRYAIAASLDDDELTRLAEYVDSNAGAY